MLSMLLLLLLLLLLPLPLEFYSTTIADISQIKIACHDYCRLVCISSVEILPWIGVCCVLVLFVHLVMILL